MTKKHKPSAVYKETQSKKSSGLASLLWMIFGLGLAVALAAAVYFSPLFDGYRTSQIHIEEESQVQPMSQTQVVPPPTFDFYEELPKQDFRSIPEGVSVQDGMDTQTRTLNADAVVESSGGRADEELQIEVVEEEGTYDGDDNSVAQHTPKNTVTYILQIKSYPDAADADEKRAQVMLAGVDAVVLRRVDKATGASFYQVVSTPMATRSEASNALFKLRNNGIDALMVEQHHK